jgi:hypothetical protein
MALPCSRVDFIEEKPPFFLRFTSEFLFKFASFLKLGCHFLANQLSDHLVHRQIWTIKSVNSAPTF